MTYIKICGITREEDAECAINSGVNALGFIAFPKSPRYITAVRFGELVNFVDNRVPCVVVFVNPTQAEVDSYVKAGADVLQFHGQEEVEFVNSQKVTCWKAFNIRNQQQVDDLAQAGYEVEKYLIDSFIKDATVPGGTGHVANWDLSRYAVDTLPAPVILAGGISAKNLQEAMDTVAPFGLDLSSSVEISPGIKDRDKIRMLF